MKVLWVRSWRRLMLVYQEDAATISPCFILTAHTLPILPDHILNKGIRKVLERETEL